MIPRKGARNSSVLSVIRRPANHHLLSSQQQQQPCARNRKLTAKSCILPKRGRENEGDTTEFLARTAERDLLGRVTIAKRSDEKVKKKGRPKLERNNFFSPEFWHNPGCMTRYWFTLWKTPWGVGVLFSLRAAGKEEEKNTHAQNVRALRLFFALGRGFRLRKFLYLTLPIGMLPIPSPEKNWEYSRGMLPNIVIFRCHHLPG